MFDKETKWAIRVGHFNGIEELINLAGRSIHNLESVQASKADSRFEELDREGLGWNIAFLQQR